MIKLEMGQIKTMKQRISEKHIVNIDHRYTCHTTIALQKVTKERLVSSKALGQCYDGFISELIDYWERHRTVSSLCAPGIPIPHNRVRE